MYHDDVAIDIKAMLEGAEAPATDECCIYRVPFDIRKLNEDAYTPKVVSIGPFHHNSSPRLHNMERHKLICCNAFLKRSNTSLESWIRYIEEVEPKFRSCYSDPLEFSKKELVKIIFVDSGFIFELFWRAYYDDWSEVGDILLLKPWLSTNIRLDLMLLENQLPFFVLDGLFKMSLASLSGGGGNKNTPSFVNFTLDYFDYYNRSKLKPDDIGIKHFTDLLRTLHLQHPLQIRIGSGDSDIYHPSAIELSEAGVTFKVNTESDCLLDLKFSGQVLEIPQLKVEDWTELLFRNMVALEQCHYPYESYITDYVVVLDLLINDRRDVDILVQEKVLIIRSGYSDLVADMFNGLRTNITYMNFCSHYFSLSQDLNSFCRNPWHKFKSNLRRDLRQKYFKTTWQTAVSIAGIFLLLLSLVQSVCSVLQVLQQYDASSSPKT